MCGNGTYKSTFKYLTCVAMVPIKVHSIILHVWQWYLQKYIQSSYMCDNGTYKSTFKYLTCVAMVHTKVHSNILHVWQWYLQKYILLHKQET